LTQTPNKWQQQVHPQNRCYKVILNSFILL
jgi:hypothetical protein